MKKHLFCFLTVILVMFSGMSTAEAKTVGLGFQTGAIYAAEFTAYPLEIGALDSTPYPYAYKSPRYAVVVLKMHARRSISPLDYNLTINNVTANCIAAASNMEAFVSNPAVLYPDDKDFVRMVFIFDGNRVKGNGKTLNAVLRPNINGRKPVSFKITDLGKKPLSDVKKIPAGGMLQ